MATVTFDHVNKVYGDFHAVKDLNLEIGDAEFMVLVGPSGCGCSSRQPRLAIQARAAASRGTTSEAPRPEGNWSSTTSTQYGRFSGARFW